MRGAYLLPALLFGLLASETATEDEGLLVGLPDVPPDPIDLTGRAPGVYLPLDLDPNRRRKRRPATDEDVRVHAAAQDRRAKKAAKRLREASRG